MTNWISVNERLPEFGEQVFVYAWKYCDGKWPVHVAARNDELNDQDPSTFGFVDLNGMCIGYVTHWRPLPAPPDDRERMKKIL